MDNICFSDTALWVEEMLCWGVRGGSSSLSNMSLPVILYHLSIFSVHIFAQKKALHYFKGHGVGRPTIVGGADLRM